MTRVLLTLGLALSLAGGTASAGVRWLHYRSSEGSPAVVIIRARCIGAEDSAAHLRLVEYGDGRAVYGCSRKGY